LNDEISRPEDKAFVASFALTPEVSAFMNRDELLKFKIDLTPGGATALHDAVVSACKERMQADSTQPARRVLVVLSDGGDNMSHFTREETIATALRAGTVIFTVSTSESPNGNLDSSRLEQFADKTGGQAFLHLNRKDLPKVFSSIKEQIGNMYALTFVPAATGKAGDYRPIELKITSGKKTKLRAPKGYYLTAAIQ
jgi:VWFA-related protein